MFTHPHAPSLFLSFFSVGVDFLIWFSCKPGITEMFLYRIQCTRCIGELQCLSSRDCRICITYLVYLVHNTEYLYFFTIPGVASVTFFCFCFRSLFIIVCSLLVQFCLCVCVCIGIRLMTMKCARRSMCTSVCNDKMSIKQLVVHS